MNGIEAILAALFFCFIGALAGVAFAYTFIEPKYKQIVEETKLDCLRTVRENYAREQANRELLLRELGEALEIDEVYLPSFGCVVLRETEDA